MDSPPPMPPVHHVPPSSRFAQQAFQQYMDTLEQRCLRASETNTAFDEISALMKDECSFGRMLLTKLRRCEQADANVQAETDQLRIRAVEHLRVGNLIDLFNSRPTIANERRQRHRDICRSILRVRHADREWLLRIQTRRVRMLNQYVRSVL